MANKTSKSQLESNERWRKNNREKSKIISYRSTARTFVRYYANDDDIKELLEIYQSENPNAKNKE